MDKAYMRQHLDEMLVLLEASRTECLERIESNKNVLLGHGWVVVAPQMLVSYAFEIVNNRIIGILGMTSILTATTFTQSDAVSVAKTIRDGSGAYGRAMHINDALKLKVADDDNLIGVLQERLMELQ